MDLSDVEMFSGTHIYNNPELTKKFLKGAKEKFGFEKEDYKNWRFIGSTHDPKRYTETVKKYWKKKAVFPTREQIHDLDQSETFMGQLDEDGDLRVDCVCCKPHLKNYSIIMDITKDWSDAYWDQQVIGNDCIKKFYHEDAFKPICVECREVVKLVPKQDKCPECYYPKCRGCGEIMKGYRGSRMGLRGQFCRDVCMEGYKAARKKAYCGKCGAPVKRNLKAKKLLCPVKLELNYPFYEWCYPCNPKYSEWECKKM